MNDDELERKLKRERVEVCLNCQNFLNCHEIGEYEICTLFREVEGEIWNVVKTG